MTKIFLIVLFTALSFSILSQNFVYNTGQHRIDTVINENYESYEIQIVTPSPENITFKWEMISNSFDPNWSYSICDYNGCYVGFPNAASMSPITATEMAAGTFGFIKCNITCGTNFNEGLAQIYVYDANDYNRGDTISFQIVWSTPFGHISENKIAITTYPNPFTEQINIKNNSNTNKDILLQDALGKKIYSTHLKSTNTQTVDLSQCSNGIYLLSFIDNKGNKTTKKIVKQ